MKTQKKGHYDFLYPIPSGVEIRRIRKLAGFGFGFAGELGKVVHRPPFQVVLSR